MTNPNFVGGVPASPSQTLEDLLKLCPNNKTITDNIIIAWNKINDPKYKKVLCSISGGADSDIMLDICIRCDKDKKVDYVWFDTGLEYQATKDHLVYLENRYGIQITRYKAAKPIPVCCKQYGQPFVSKRVSRLIEDLQRHNFEWEDGDFETLDKKYPRCKAPLKWWCNIASNGKYTVYNISENKGLKEFLMENPPTFKISPKCCDYAKKNVAHKLIKDGHYDLNCMGIRKYEGGIRSGIYKSCFSNNTRGGEDDFRPIFWYKDADKKEYEEAFEIVHSECYTKYGLQRTGCAGCPFARNMENELEIVKQYEPKLHNAITNIFAESCAYTRAYRNFAKNLKN